jgi:hypothetical protein
MNGGQCRPDLQFSLNSRNESNNESESIVAPPSTLFNSSILNKRMSFSLFKTHLSFEYQIHFKRFEPRIIIYKLQIATSEVAGKKTYYTMLLQ